ncbi:MAG TPA: DMT family transporter [Sphingomicrobium sp.]|nr:DMT family transporter [Sphingomicrobium sp.]
MATTGETFDRNCRDAAAAAAGYRSAMIHTVMNRADWAILAALALIWGAAFLFIKVAVTHFEPLTYVWLRLSIAAAGLALLLRWRGERLALPGAVWASILLLALLNNIIPFALFGWGQTRIASGLASILNATTPVWGVLVTHLMTRDEKMTPAKLFGVAAGFAGVAVMIGPGLLSNLGSDLMAQLACLAGAFCYAIAGAWARRFKAQGIAPMKVAAAQLIVGALVMAPVVLAVDGRPVLDVPAEAWGALIALALLCTAFAYILYFKLIDSAGATNALLVTLLVPPVAILLGSLALGEKLGLASFAGLALIAVGLAAIDGRLPAAGRRLLPA